MAATSHISLIRLVAAIPDNVGFPGGRSAKESNFNAEDQETQVRSLSWRRAPGEEMAPHSVLFRENSTDRGAHTHGQGRRRMFSTLQKVLLDIAWNVA